MFTPRSARARKHLPSAPGLSSIVTVNSFAFAMRLDPLPFQDTASRRRGLYHTFSCDAVLSREPLLNTSRLHLYSGMSDCALIRFVVRSVEVPKTTEQTAQPIAGK